MVDDMQNDMEAKVVQVGDTVKGKVTQIEEKNALVDFGSKQDGILPIGEIANVHLEKVADALSVGDELELHVIRITEEDEVILSKRRVDQESAWENLALKQESGEVFEVEVADVVKGGLVVDVGVRGFIPASLVERHYVEDFSDYKGRTLRVKVMELDREKNKLILSQKAVLDEEAEAAKKERIQEIETGDVLEGRVARLTSFGAFVDIGGVDGLVHISELAWNRVETPEDVLSEGEQVNVKVLNVDLDAGKVSLSIKQTEESPWEKAAATIQAGDVIEGTVKRLAPFGAFVEVIPGVEGLVHISQIANRRIGTPGEVLEEEQTVKVKVLEIHPDDERISLSIRELLDDEERQHVQEYEADEKGGSTGITIGDRIGEQLKRLK